MNMLVNPAWVVAIAAVVGVGFLIINILREYERGVVFFSVVSRP